MKWTDERVERLRKYHAEGYKRLEVAQFLETTSKSISWKASCLGLCFSKPKKGFDWTEDNQQEKLRELCLDGLSSSQIAEHFNVTRNAVIGACRRLGIELNKKSGFENTRKWTKQQDKDLKSLVLEGFSNSQIAKTLGRSKQAIDSRIIHQKLTGLRNTGKKTEQPSNEAPTAKVQRRQEPDVIVPEDERRGLADRHDDQCRWPIGDPRKPGFHYCNGKRAPGMQFCDHHCRVAYSSYAKRSASGRGGPPADQRSKRTSVNTDNVSEYSSPVKMGGVS